jgi:hypothetical protein
METTELANELRNMLMRLAHINDCFLLHKKLLTYTTEMNTEMNIAPAFFQIVMYSLEHTYMVDLFKLYDRDRNSKGLRKAINLCEQHSTIFPKERILFRDTESNHNEVVKINIIKDIKEIREKLDLIDPVVNSLKGRRDNYYAHTDKAYVDDLPQLASNYPLSFKQVADLIQTANEILNTLLRDLCGEVVAQSSTNYDDVKNIFEILKAYQNN